MAGQAGDGDVVAARMKQRAEVAELDRAAGDAVQAHNRPSRALAVVQDDRAAVRIDV